MEIITYSDKYKKPTIELIFDIVENEFGRHSKSGRPELYKITEVYQNNGGNFWLAIDNEKVISTIGLRNCGEKKGYLERFYVDKKFRRKGIGYKLLTVLLEFAKNNGYREIFLSTWEDLTAANNFYVKNGFKKVSSLPENFPSTKKDEIFFRLEL